MYVLFIFDIDIINIITNDIIIINIPFFDLSVFLYIVGILPIINPIKNNIVAR